MAHKQTTLPIKLLISDVDGVLTDGFLHFDANGELFKSFNVQDGYGFTMLQKANINIAIISGNSSNIIQQRCQSLGVRQIFLGIDNKLDIYRKLKQEHQLSDEEIVCVGDDLPDIPLLQNAGTGIAVANAHPTVKANANWITQNSGGNGAIREVCDWIVSILPC